MKLKYRRTIFALTDAPQEGLNGGGPFDGWRLKISRFGGWQLNFSRLTVNFSEWRLSHEFKTKIWL